MSVKRSPSVNITFITQKIWQNIPMNIQTHMYSYSATEQFHMWDWMACYCVRLFDMRSTDISCKTDQKNLQQ